MSTYGIGQVLKDAVMGKLEVSPGQESDSRYRTCQACPFFNGVVFTCGKCGCFMPAKVKLKEATCPVGKW